MVNSVPGAVVTRVVTLARTFALGVAGIVADESGAAHQQVKQEAEHLHADGDQEEDERVPPLVLDQQLGEDARQRDDHPRCAWVRAEDDAGNEETVKKGEGDETDCSHVRVCTYSLRSSPPVCTSWAASPCSHRNWTAALGRDEQALYQCQAVKNVWGQFTERPCCPNLHMALERSCSDL